MMTPGGAVGVHVIAIDPPSAAVNWRLDLAEGKGKGVEGEFPSLRRFPSSSSASFNNLDVRVDSSSMATDSYRLRDDHHCAQLDHSKHQRGSSEKEESIAGQSANSEKQICSSSNEIDHLLMSSQSQLRHTAPTTVTMTNEREPERERRILSGSGKMEAGELRGDEKATTTEGAAVCSVGRTHPPSIRGEPCPPQLALVQLTSAPLITSVISSFPLPFSSCSLPFPSTDSSAELAESAITDASGRSGALQTQSTQMDSVGGDRRIIPNEDVDLGMDGSKDSPTRAYSCSSPTTEETEAKNGGRGRASQRRGRLPHALLPSDRKLTLERLLHQQHKRQQSSRDWSLSANQDTDIQSETTTLT